MIRRTLTRVHSLAGSRLAVTPYRQISTQRERFPFAKNEFKNAPFRHVATTGKVFNPQEKSSVMFTLKDNAGALNSALAFFETHSVSMTRIESRPSKRSSDYEFYVDFKGCETDHNVSALLSDLRMNCREVNMLHSYEVPWFPRKVREVDKLASKILDAGADLEADHPGFSDPVYRQRREVILESANTFKLGDSIKRIDYTPEEIKTWSVVYNKLTPLLKKHACAEHVRMMPLLVENCGYRADNIPQLQDISMFLKECTGFTMRPVGGLLSARNFLYGLAFRIFFSTQYIRHGSKPLYTPEPDVCHELLGHAPLFADQNFADFSQEIGLAALGASDEQILKLARVYWFTVEFGLCEQFGERKAYGAGLLSSFGELEYAMSDEPELLHFDPFVAGEKDYPITTYQPTYFLASSFEEAKTEMQAFSNSFARPFNVRYNPYTQSIEVDRNVKVCDEDDERYAAI